MHYALIISVLHIQVDSQNAPVRYYYMDKWGRVGLAGCSERLSSSQPFGRLFMQFIDNGVLSVPNIKYDIYLVRQGLKL